MNHKQDSLTRNLVTAALFAVLVVVSFSIGHSVGQSSIEQLPLPPPPCEKKQSNRRFSNEEWGCATPTCREPHRFSTEIRGEDKRKVF